MAYREGNRRGRPILVAVRVPMTVEKCRHIGIDIERWLKEDLLDVLITGGGYVPFTMPTSQLVELGHAHDVPVYPTISWSGLNRPSDSSGFLGRFAWHRTQAWRGAAANALDAGADGIYIFNHFPNEPKDPVFITVGDRKTLAGLNKLFIVDNIPINLRQAVVKSHILPVKLDPEGKPQEIILPIAGDDFREVAKTGYRTKPRFTRLYVRCSSLTKEDKLGLRLNGTEVKPDEVDYKKGWVIYKPQQELYRSGDNKLEFYVTSTSTAGAKKSIAVENVEVEVWYK